MENIKENDQHGLKLFGIYFSEVNRINDLGFEIDPWKNLKKTLSDSKKYFKFTMKKGTGFLPMFYRLPILFLFFIFVTPFSIGYGLFVKIFLRKKRLGKL